MSETFDPYLNWLGIRDPERPPNHYVLLGVQLFEDHPDVLAHTADRQMAHVRTFQTGPHSIESQQLLNELAAAKLCLLDPAKKAAYDAELLARRRGNAPAAEGPKIVAPSPRQCRVSKSRWVPTAVAIVVALALVGGAIWVLANSTGPVEPAVAPGVAVEPKAAPPPEDPIPIKAEPAPTPPEDEPPPKNTEPSAPPSDPFARPPVDIRPDMPWDWRAPPKSRPSRPGVVVRNPLPPTPVVGHLETPPPTPAFPAPSPPPAPSTRKEPVPDVADRAPARLRVQTLIAPRLSRAVTPEQKVAAARFLIVRGHQTANEPAFRHALLLEAGGLAAEAGDAELVRGTAEVMAQYFDTTVDAATADVVDDLAARPRGAVWSRAAAMVVAELAGEAARKESFDAAQKMLDRAVELARKSHDAPTVKQAVAWQKALASRREMHEAFQQADRTLAREPGNAAASLMVGRYLCFVRGDWRRGCEQLAQGVDGRLRYLASQEQKGADSPEAMVALADAWWNAARSAPSDFRADYYARARHWYRRSERQLPDAPRARVQARLAEIQQILGRGQ
ncbi:MAG: hypothetical protein JW809_20070 [Pirellulales bacterium]|nr:hypothetical protein [Pirellulales bacterium]